jgi:hypothetical protein
MPGVATAVKVVSGLAKVNEAIKAGKSTDTVIQAAQPVLEVLKVAYPKDYHLAMDVLGSLIKVYDAVQKGDVEAALNANLDGVIVAPGIELTVQEVLSRATQKLGNTLLKIVYDTSKTAVSLVGEQFTFRELQERHEQILRLIGQIRRQNPSCSSTPAYAPAQGTERASDEAAIKVPDPTSRSNKTVPLIPRDKCDKDYLDGVREYRDSCERMTANPDPAYKEWCVKLMPSVEQDLLTLWKECKRIVLK